MKNNERIRIIPLGGLDEIGKNLTVVEYEDDAVIVDCGMGFPDEDQLGIDIVLPDFAYLKEIEDKIRGIVITHGHEDHIGAIPYLLKELKCPIFGSTFSIGLIGRKINEHGIEDSELHSVRGGESIRLGIFKIQFISMTHSIPGSFAIVFFTPVGTILFSGDFRLDMTPIGEAMDMQRLGALAQKGIDLLVCDSTNVDRPGYTKSEKSVVNGLRDCIQEAKGRIIIASFASNLYRIQQIIAIAAEERRKVAISGRSMQNAIDIAMELNCINIPNDIIINMKEIPRYQDDEILVLMTGSQGERFSALSRLANDNHYGMTIKASDTVVLSASQVPGNEKAVTSLINTLYKKCEKVIYGSLNNVHVSGHACQEELKVFYGLVRPRFFIPVHGEYWRQVLNKNLAVSVCVRPSNAVIAENGDIIEVTRKKIGIVGSVPHGQVFVDGSGIGDIGSGVLRDRLKLSQNGIVFVMLYLDAKLQSRVTNLEIYTRGFIYEKESKEYIERMKEVVREYADKYLNDRKKHEKNIRVYIYNKVASFIRTTTGRRPIIEIIVVNDRKA